MAQLKLGAIKDLGGIGGFTLTSGGVTANGTLTVNDLVIDGTMGGSSSFVLPNPSGQSGRFVTNNGSSLSWGDVNLSTGIRSMQVWTSNGTWSRPSGVKTIMVTVTGAGGGGSGFCESGGAGGTAQRQVDVTNVSSVSVSVGNPGGGTNYSGCGGNGNSSSSGGYGANCRQGRAGGIGGNGSGGNLNVYGGGGNGHGSFHSYGSHSSGVGYFGGGQPASHNQRNYAHRHQSHAAWGAGGNGTRQNNRGARGREGVVVVHEFYG